MTHCGFGGTLEFIFAGIPVICYPHFGDQPANANLLVERGVGVYLPNQKINPTSITRTFVDPVFDANDVKTKFNAIITDGKYKENMKKLQLQIRATGGRKLAADTV